MKKTLKTLLMVSVLASVGYATSDNQDNSDKNLSNRLLKKVKYEETTSSLSLDLVLKMDTLSPNILKYLTHSSLYNLASTRKKIFSHVKELRDIYKYFEEANPIFHSNSPSEILNEIYGRPVRLFFMEEKGSENRLSNLVQFLSKFQRIEVLKIDGYDSNYSQGFESILLNNPIKRFSLGGIDITFAEERNFEDTIYEFSEVFGQMKQLEFLTLRGYFESHLITSLYQRSSDHKLKKLSIDDNEHEMIDGYPNPHAIVSYILLAGKVEVIKGVNYLLVNYQGKDLSKEVKKEIKEKGTMFKDRTTEIAE